jgi:hypothetical protein
MSNVKLTASPSDKTDANIRLTGIVDCITTIGFKNSMRKILCLVWAVLTGATIITVVNSSAIMNNATSAGNIAAWNN